MATILLSLLGHMAVVIVAVFTCLFMLFSLYIYYIHRKYADLPQVPMPSFFFGHKKYFDESEGYLYQEMHKELGCPPVFVLFVIHLAVVIVVDPQAVKEVIFDNSHVKPREFYRTLMSMFGQRFTQRGLLTEMDYEQWHKRRIILNTAFHRKSLKEFMDPFNKSTTLFINKLKEKADGKTEIKMFDHFGRCVLDVVSKVGLDLDLDIIDNEDSSFVNAVHSALHGMLIGGNMAFQVKSLFLPTLKKEKTDVIKAVKHLRVIGKDCVEKRINAMAKGQEVPQDILSFIIKSGQEVKGDDEEKIEVMIDEFVLFFFAGMETTANMLSFALLALGRNPEILHRLMIEIDAVVGDKEYITYEDINNLEYTMQVLKESLRLWPPVMGMLRKLGHDVEVQGYKVPAGSNTLFMSYLMSRMDKFFHNAHDFYPDRFKTKEDTMQYTYFPFAIGPKSCIGQQFAMIEAKVILARFLSSFNFKLVPGQSFGYQTEITLKPKGGCKVILSPK